MTRLPTYSRQHMTSLSDEEHQVCPPHIKLQSSSKDTTSSRTRSCNPYIQFCLACASHSIHFCHLQLVLRTYWLFAALRNQIYLEKAEMHMSILCVWKTVILFIALDSYQICKTGAYITRTNAISRPGRHHCRRFQFCP